jgi:hypothetical protein
MLVRIWSRRRWRSYSTKPRQGPRINVCRATDPTSRLGSLADTAPAVALRMMSGQLRPTTALAR